MPTTGINYDKTCPKCAGPGEPTKATTGQRGAVVVDMRCPQCTHTWVLTLITRTEP